MKHFGIMAIIEMLHFVFILNVLKYINHTLAAFFGIVYEIQG